MRKTVILGFAFLLYLAGAGFGVGAGLEWYDNHDVNNFTVLHCAVTPTIDGVLSPDEWTAANWHDCDEIRWPFPPEEDPPTVSDWPDDLLAYPGDVKMAVMWNSLENLIYVAVTGTDTAHYFDPQHVTYDHADCLEIFVDANNSDALLRHSHEYAQQYRMGCNGSGGAWMWGYIGEGGIETEDLTTRTPEWAATVVGDTITYEVSIIPFKKIVFDETNGQPTTGTEYVTLSIDAIVGLSVAWNTRFAPPGTPDTQQTVGVAPSTQMWKEAQYMCDHKIGPGDTSRAYAPDPGHGAMDIDYNKVLAWKASDYGVKENVYFGTDPGAMVKEVTDRVVTPNSDQSYDPDPWQPYPLGETYYWRVDDNDVNDDIITGYQWRFTVTGAATDPGPLDGAEAYSWMDGNDEVVKNMTLTWQAGTSAEQHLIYLGTDETKVADSDSSTYQGIKLAGQENYDLTNLVLGTKYYWKVNERSGGGSHIVDGVVWNFTLADYLVIENFQSYNSIPEIQAAWPKDILGAAYTSSLGYGGDKSGSKAMTFMSSNDDPPYQSTVYHNIANEDWSVDGCTALSVMFRGSATNPVPDDIFVELESGGGALNGRQYYGDPNATRISDWTEWFIDMSAFGVNEADITKIKLGVGQSPPVVATQNCPGQMFDYVRIALPRYMCKPGQRPTADIDGDCDADGQDLLKLLGSWLDYDEYTSNFDADLAETNFTDHGHATDSQWANPGLIFNDDANEANWNDYLDIDDYLLDHFENRTIVAWIKQHTPRPYQPPKLISSSPGYILGSDMEYRCYIMINETNDLCAAIGQQTIAKRDCQFGFYDYNHDDVNDKLNIGQEYFVALVVENDANQSKFYVDTEPMEGPDPNLTIESHSDDPDRADRLLGVCLGGYNDNATAKNSGMVTIRDFAIFDRALTSEEIGDIYSDDFFGAGDPFATHEPNILLYKLDETAGVIAQDTCTADRTVYHPIKGDEAANIAGSKDEGDQEINLIDYATLAGDWLDCGLGWWP